MSDSRLVQADRPTVTRRSFLKVAGTGAAGGALLAMLDARQAPAQLKGTSLRVILWSHFVPAYDAWIDDFARKWGEQNGATVRIDHIPHLELPARYAAEFAAGAGHDLIYFAGQILTGQYYRHLLDLSDLANDLGTRYGPWMPSAKSAAQVAGVWYAVPDYFIAIPVLWRKDLFESVGRPAPKTWDDLRVAARLLRPKGHPTGMQFSHCNDANHNWRALLYCFGAKETDPSGQSIELDSKETREALRFAKALYDEGMTPEVFSWDDASDNRYLASGVACWVHDAISAYRTTEDTNPPVFQNTFLGLEPQGLPGKRVSVAAPNVWMVWKFSKNQQAAKEWLAYLIDNDLEGMVQSRGYNMPYLTDRYKKPMPVIGTDPKLQILQDFPKIVAFYGYPGPSTTPIQEIVNTFIFPDMVTRACRGKESIEESIKWGVGEYRRIYAKHKQA